MSPSIWFRPNIPIFLKAPLWQRQSPKLKIAIRVNLILMMQLNFNILFPLIEVWDLAPLLNVVRKLPLADSDLTTKLGST